MNVVWKLATEKFIWKHFDLEQVAWVALFYSKSKALQFLGGVTTILVRGALLLCL